jgi:hypothetical protein
MSGIEIDPRKFNISRYLKLAIISLTMFVVYFGIVQIWNITSVENKPLDSLDFAVRTPRGNFFARRENAICPTENVTDLVNLDCFIRQ